MPDLSIIIVTWNVAGLLRACLDSIAANKGDLAVEVIVVDSASADGTVPMLREAYPEVHLIACSENVGFPRGNNLGLAQARGDFILLLNPDTEIIGEALQMLVAYLRHHPDVGVVGPQLLNGDGSHQSSRRRFPTLLTALFESTWFQPWAPRRVLDQYYVHDISYEDTASVDWLTGACLVTRRRVVDQVGGLDPGYYMYSEELDWCRRVKAVGWKIVYLPRATVLHHVGASRDQAGTARHINFNRAKLRYFRKFHGAGAYRLLRGWLLLNYGLQLLLEASKWIVGHKRTLRRERLQAYRQVLTSGLTAAGYR